MKLTNPLAIIANFPCNIIRNGEPVKTIGRLLERDQSARDRGCSRVAHGVEIDALLSLETQQADALAERMIQERARSNARTVVFRMGMATAAEVEVFGVNGARRRARRRSILWAASNWRPVSRWGWTLTPRQYARTGEGAQAIAGQASS